MYEPKLEKHLRCPLEYGLNIFAGKWKPRIICVLAKYHQLRYTQLREVLDDASDTVLANALKELQDEDIVERKQYDEIPPRVEYRLSAKGKSVIPILQLLCQWAEPYFEGDPNDPLTANQCLNVSDAVIVQHTKTQAH